MIKKGWDLLYMDPIKKEGFLEQSKQIHKFAQEQLQKDKKQSLFDTMKPSEDKNSSLDGFEVLKVDVISMNDQETHSVQTIVMFYQV